MRINSEGVKLNQADFILTLLSVFWDEGRHALEHFCRDARRAPGAGAKPSPFNHHIQPDPDQLLRVSVALGFNRGRLKCVYQLLRGKDVDTEKFEPALRVAQFAALNEAQSHVLNLVNWHQFMSALVGAGYRSSDMVSSQTALLYTYALYLIGRVRFGLPERELQKLIGRWFFFSSLTGRYTTSSESVMDSDLNRVKEASDASRFHNLLDELMRNELTNDFCGITLPANLDTSSARNPEFFAFLAAQNRLSAPVLFSHKKVSDLIDPALKLKKKALDRHHLFPRAHLEREGITDLKQVNQVANYAMLEWPENIDISDAAPSEYIPVVRERFDPATWQTMQELHALPRLAQHAL